MTPDNNATDWNTATPAAAAAAEPAPDAKEADQATPAPATPAVDAAIAAATAAVTAATPATAETPAPAPAPAPAPEPTPAVAAAPAPSPAGATAVDVSPTPTTGSGGASRVTAADVAATPLKTHHDYNDLESGNRAALDHARSIGSKLKDVFARIEGNPEVEDATKALHWALAAFESGVSRIEVAVRRKLR